MREASAGSPARLRSRQATAGAKLSGAARFLGRRVAATTGWAGATSSCRGAGRAIGARDGAGAGAAPEAVAGPRRRFRPPRRPRRRGFVRGDPGVSVVAGAASEPCISSARPFISSDRPGSPSVASPATSALAYAFAAIRMRERPAPGRRDEPGVWDAEVQAHSADSATSASGTPSTLLCSADSTGAAPASAGAPAPPPPWSSTATCGIVPPRPCTNARLRHALRPSRATAPIQMPPWHRACVRRVLRVLPPRRCPF